MTKHFPVLVAITTVLILQSVALAQHPPAIGYVHPSVVQAGQTADVILGGYDWTPDMQVFVLDPRITLEMLGPPGEIIVPAPPYWFGKKSRRPPFLLPRETKARLTIPADVPPGLVTWQVASANGASATGRFVISQSAAVLDVDSPAQPQQIASLPVLISGQIKHIREVDQYQFAAEISGPVTCSVSARKFGSPLSAVVEVRDSASQVVADAADTAGMDTELTFAAKAGETYTVSIYDLDFRGNRSFTYQLSIIAGPRVVAAIPSFARRGETRRVELVGYGVATGKAVLESVSRDVTFPEDGETTSFPYRLKTEHGECPPFLLHISDEPQVVEGTSPLAVPGGVTGVLDERFSEDRYQVTGKKDDVWAIDVSGERIGSRVDPVLTVFNSAGKQLAQNDDRSGSMDAELEFTVPADGQYQISVSDVASQSGKRTATYHLSIRGAEPDFSLSIPESLNAPIDGKAKLALKVTRRGGFQDPIDVSLTGLPPGVTAPDNLQIAAKKNALNIELTVAADAPASAALVKLTAAATINERLVQRSTEPMLVATTIKPPFTIDAEGKDDVTKWPRGTTFPAPVLIERDEGFSGDIVLEMTSKQGRHRQGIFGPELIVKPTVNRILYPVFLPEWLETTRTSRMVVNGVARVLDPKGNLRYSVSRQKTRMGFLPTGALLKLSAELSEFQARWGQQIDVPVTIDRADELTEPVAVELVCDDAQSAFFVAEPQSLSGDVSRAVFSIGITSTASATTEHQLKLRATLLKNGHLPVISETTVLVELTE